MNASTPPAAMPPAQRIPRWRAVALLIVVGLGVVGGVTWNRRADLLAAAAVQALERSGVGPVRLTVERVGLSSVLARDVGLYGGLVTASTIEFTFRPTDLYEQKIEKIKIAGLHASVSVDRGNLSIGGHPLSASTAAGGPGTMALGSAIVSDMVVDVSLPELPAPLRVTGKAAWGGHTADFDVIATMTGPHQSTLEIAARGAHDLASWSGQADIAVSTMKFHRGSKQPRDLLPALGTILPLVDGQADAKGTLSWSESGVIPDLLVRLSDIAFDTNQAKVKGINGSIRLSGFAPPSTPPHQVVKASIEPGGLPPSAFTLQFQLLPKGAIAVEALTVDFANGKLAASPFTIDTAHPAIDSTLRFSAVDLDRVLRLLNIEDVAGTGRLDGQVGLHVRDGKLRIDDSRLIAAAPGILHISNRWLTERLAGDNETLRQATLALNDFHYEALALELTQTKTGDGSIILHLQGNNPAVLQGQVFDFNIRLDSNFDRLTEIALRSVTAAHQLLRAKEL